MIVLGTETKWDVVGVAVSGWLSVPAPVPVSDAVASAPLEMLWGAIVLTGLCEVVMKGAERHVAVSAPLDIVWALELVGAV